MKNKKKIKEVSSEQDGVKSKKSKDKKQKKQSKDKKEKSKTDNKKKRSKKRKEPEPEPEPESDPEDEGEDAMKDVQSVDLFDGEGDVSEDAMVDEELSQKVRDVVVSLLLV